MAKRGESYCGNGIAATMGVGTKMGRRESLKGYSER